MEVVYFFGESHAIRVPYFGYHVNLNLFGLFINLGGIWDKAGHQFIFSQNMNAELFSRSLPDIPCVWVEKESSDPIRIFGFWEHPWEKDTDTSAPFTIPSHAEKAAYIPPVLPEKFPEYWQIKLEEALRSRKYSLRTLRSYVYYNRLLCRILQKIPDEINSEDITNFLATIEKYKEYSASSINLAISAIKFFYQTVFRNKISIEHHRPSQDKRLPMVLAKSEIQKILSTEKNLKHRLLLMLTYSSGLRVSEVVALKKKHIDLSRRVIHVRLGKGRKDRCTILSEKAVRLIGEYYTLYDIQTWLFPGQIATHPLTIRSAQKIFDKAVRHAGIQKEVSIHSFRHTFATHLLENGTDIRYIQALMGHSSLRTTERYTHVAQRNVLNIQSPLDTIL